MNRDGFDSTEESNWERGAPDGPQVPYYANYLANAPADAVFDITEGEKDADTAYDIGLAYPTTNWDGAMQWASELDPHFDGHPVRLYEDNDKSGKRHVQIVARRLKNRVSSIQIIRFREFDKKGFDLTDFVEKRREEGKSDDDIREEVLARATQYEDLTNEAFKDAFLEKTKTDPAAPFKHEIIEALALLKIEEVEAFQRLWGDFRKRKVALGDLKKRVDAEERELRKRDKTQNENCKVRNYEMTEDGLVLHTEEGDIRICDRFEVPGESRDPKENSWGLVLRFKNRDGNERRYIVSISNLLSPANTVCADLGGIGLAIEYDRQKDVCIYLAGVKVESRLTVAKRPGWIKLGGWQSIFALPDMIIPEVIESEKIVTDFTSKHERKGSLDAWRNGVATIVKDHRIPSFILCCAFVGPLIEPTGEESGGVHIQAFSSKGKTTVEIAAASVWGNGSIKDGYIKSWNSTENALESSATDCKDTCIILDEINQADSKVVSSAAYKFMNGIGKQRMNRNLTAVT